jgi:hypothetical protein
MVHGTNYGVQYVIYLNEEVDFFNDILPICINVRHMIEYSKNLKKSKLVIFSDNNFYKRFSAIPHAIKYVSCLTEQSYNYSSNNPDADKYRDVKLYNNSIKYSEKVELYTEEMYQALTNKIQGLTDLYQLLQSQGEYSELQSIRSELLPLRDILKIQDITKNKEYYEEIKEIEKDITNIELTDEEKDIISRVLNHPNLEGKYTGHGISLIDYFF